MIVVCRIGVSKLDQIDFSKVPHIIGARKSFFIAEDIVCPCYTVISSIRWLLYCGKKCN